MKFQTSFILILFFSLQTWAAEFPAHWNFRVLQTAHFNIIVNAEQQDLGRFYASKLERAYELVTPLFTDIPDRVTVVLADKTDLTNGYATRLPYPHMFFFPVLPGPQESISESGDWVLEFAIHELTHILTFEAVSGWAEPLQSVFGTILSPNLLLPTWWKEGVAVETETLLSHGGRLRSAYQDGVLRTLAEEGSLSRFDIATINERIPFWTEGMSAYLFGSIFWSEAVSKNGKKIIDELHQSHGGRLPYAITAPAKKYLGATYTEFYTRAMRDLQGRLSRQNSFLKGTLLTESTKLHFKTQYSQGPRFNPAGTLLAVIAVDETDRRALRIFERNPTTQDFVSPIENIRFINRREEEVTPSTQDAPPSGSISRLSWFPDQNKLVFDKVDRVSRYESYSDLWTFDVEKRTSNQLTVGLRAREPFVSRDGSKIYFVKLSGAKTSLASYDLSTKNIEILLEGVGQDRISFPVELEDGGIVFSVRGEDGWEGLKRLRPGSTTPEVILDDFPDARFPEVTSEGLLFTSTLNGVHNLYLSSSDFLTAKPVSHVLGGIYSSTMDPIKKDYYVTAMTSKGLQTQKISSESSRQLPAVLPKVERVFADRFPKPDRALETAEVAIAERDYSPGSYLLPRYWIPFVSLSAVNNSLVIEASTAAHDPLKKHLYSLSAGWDSGVEEASYLAAYQNNTFAHSINLGVYRTNSYLVSYENTLTNEGQSISLSPDLFRLSRYLSANIGLQHRKTIYHSSQAIRFGPSFTLQYLDFGKSGQQISPEEGGHVMVDVTHFVPGKNFIDYTQYSSSTSYFWSKWLPSRHVIAMKLSSTYTPDSVSALYGSSTTNYFLTQDSPIPLYVVRGYEVGNFIGKTLTTLNLEYRFPLKDLYSGSGTTPLYFSRLHGAIYADAVSLEGLAYKTKEEAFEFVHTNRTFGTIGAEARLETTLGYFLPLNLIVGFANPLSPTHSKGPGITMAIQIGTLF